MDYLMARLLADELVETRVLQKVAWRAEMLADHLAGMWDHQRAVKKDCIWVAHWDDLTAAKWVIKRVE